MVYYWCFATVIVSLRLCSVNWSSVNAASLGWAGVGDSTPPLFLYLSFRACGPRKHKVCDYKP
jgi:hypothetical protein